METLITRKAIDEIVQACVRWVQQHHRTTLSGMDKTEIRRKLIEKFERERKGSLEDYVRLAHSLACGMVDQRRDAAQLAQTARMVRA